MASRSATRQSLPVSSTRNWISSSVAEQAVAVLREGRGVDPPLVDHKPDEPAKQHVELQPFDQLPLRAERKEKLQKRSSQKPLRRDGRTPDPLVKRRKPRVELSQSRARQPPHRPQRMPRRDARLDLDIREQGPARPILAPHRLADATESRRKPKFQNLSAQLL